MGVDQIGTKGLVDCSVAAADIAPGTITNAKLAGSIANAKLSNSSITVNGQSIALGASGAVPPVQWQSVVVSDGSTVTTMVAGRGYFVDNSSAAGIVKLPASAAIGDLISIKDYAANFGTNNLTIQRNGHNIQGNANNSEISTDRASLSLVYVDSTKGWLFTNESNVADLRLKEYIGATGGTVTTSGDFKVHTFTGDGNFIVSAVGNPAGSDKVSYMVVAGGGGSGQDGSGGAGAGGYREGKSSQDSYTASPLNAPDGLSVSVTTFPVTVGGGGAGVTSGPSNAGSNSVFSTITSAGGGKGGTVPAPHNSGGSGGSGGGSRANTNRPGGAGNTPPVSPPQGNNGGAVSDASPLNMGGGGGGAGAVGNNGGNPYAPIVQGKGGDGVASSITGSSVTRAGGGGGGYNGPGSNPGGPGGSGGGGAGGAWGGSPGMNAVGSAGTANTGGGGGGAGAGSGSGGAGGSGIVVIRYKFQN